VLLSLDPLLLLEPELSELLLPELDPPGGVPVPPLGLFVLFRLFSLLGLLGLLGLFTSPLVPLELGAVSILPPAP